MTREIPKATVPKTLGKRGGLGEKVENILRRFLALIFNALRNPLRDLFAGALELVLETVGDLLMPLTQRARGQILSDPAVPQYIKDLFIGRQSPATASDGMRSLFMFFGFILGGAFGLGAPIGRLVGYNADRAVQSARADPITAMQMMWRVGSEPEFRDSLRDLGWTDQAIAAWEAIATPRAAVADLLRLWRLEVLGEGTVDAELAKRGYSPTTVVRLKGATEFVPGPADLVGMGVREAWDNGIAAAFGYDQNFPAELGEWMRKQGDTENWAQKYWRAHWQLPGLNVMLEALHRLPDVDMDTLDLYLRVADVAPTFRDYIKRTAYSPYTRVDTRRMYAFGVLTEQEVYQSYLDQGYDSEHAANLTAFTIADATEADREATKTDILSGYTSGVISRSDAGAWLQGIGYPSDLAGYLLTREDAKRAQKLKARQISTIQKLYVRRDITGSAARTRLTGLGVSGKEIDILLDEWQITREEKVRRPSLGKLDSFLMEDVISEGGYRDELEALGFIDRYIGWHTTALLAEKTARARIEEDRARTEQQRIRDRRVKSDYQIGKAQIDVDIAELNTAIAETQEALGARRARYDRDLALARRVVPEAQLRSDAAQGIADQEALIADYQVGIETLERQIQAVDTRTADLRLELAERQAQAAPDIEALRVRLAALEAEANAEREEREAFQTQIREVELAATSQEVAAGDALALAATEEAEAAIKEALAVSLAEFEIIIAELRVRIERREDRLAELGTLADGVQEEIRLLGIPTEGITRQIREYTSQVQVAREDIGALQSSIVAGRQSITGIRSELVADLTALEVVVSVAEVEAGYLADRAEGDARLATLRSNVALLRESKAGLTVGYRQALVA